MDVADDSPSPRRSRPKVNRGPPRVGVEKGGLSVLEEASDVWHSSKGGAVGGGAVDGGSII